MDDRYDFWLGRCFEGLVRSKYEEGYVLPFAQIKNLNKRIVEAIISGVEPDVRYKKNGEVYEADKDLLDQLSMVSGSEKLPIDAVDFAVIENTVDNLLSMPVISDTTVEDLLSVSEFDVPVLWKDQNGIEYKALFDVVSTLETGDGGLLSIVFDLKYYSNPYGFVTMYRNKLWIQERHYTEALKHYAAEKGAEPYYCMPFLVGYKDTMLTQVNMIDDDNLERAQNKYDDLLHEYLGWVEEDKKPTGHLPQRFLKIW
jgi:hypothetical protein